MNEQWKELKETIIELRDNDGTGTQQEVCKFLANLMDVLEKGESLINDDAISRQEVLDLLENTNNGWIINKVLQLPPVTPQPKMGRWIATDEEPHEYYKCDGCGYIISYTANIEPHTEYKYCPNCGDRKGAVKNE